jgi:hypothetical protein
MITVKLILCKRCGVQYYGGEQDLKLKAGNERTPPTEIYFTTLKVARCGDCAASQTRSQGGPRKTLHD